MAAWIPDAPEPPRPRRPHGWRNYDEYLTVHRSWLRGLEDEGVVLGDSLSLTESRGDGGRLVRADITGRIRCVNGVSLRVSESLEARTRRDGRAEVRGVDYTCHAWRAGGGERRYLFRYDNSHGGLHIHAFDPATGEETGTAPVRRGELPNLDQLIRRAVGLAARGR